MRILIIGGTNFIGPYVVRRLSAMGHQVTVFHRGRHEADLPEGVEHLHGDRKALPDDSEQFRRFAPDVVLDMIPFTEHDARNLMNVFKGIARCIVAISSGDVYRAYGVLIGKESGPIEPVPLTESAPLRQKLHPYRGETPRGEDDPSRWMDDYDKIPVERVVMNDSELPGTVLRLPMVYGPKDGGRLFSHLKRMEDRRPAILMGEEQARWRWTRGYVENVAAAIALAITDERATGRIYNVGEEEALSEAEWAEKIGALAGWDGKVAVVPRNDLPDHLKDHLNWSQHLVTDTSRIRRELGYQEPISREEGIRRTISWERANPPSKIDPQRFNYEAEDAVLAKL